MDEIGLAKLAQALTTLHALQYLSLGMFGGLFDGSFGIAAVPIGYSGNLELRSFRLFEQSGMAQSRDCLMPKHVTGLSLKGCLFDDIGLSELLGTEPRPALSTLCLYQCSVPVSGMQLTAIAGIQAENLREVKYIGYPGSMSMDPQPTLPNLPRLKTFTCSVGLEETAYLMQLPHSLRTVRVLELDKLSFSLINDHIATLPKLERLIIDLDGPVINDHEKQWRPYIGKDEWNAVVAEALKLEQTCLNKGIRLWPTDMTLAMKAVRRGKGEAYPGR